MPGVAINPATPLAMVEELIPSLRQVLVMTVNPGFGGQSFIETMPDKIDRLRDMIERLNPDCVIQVDGGINDETIGPGGRSGSHVDCGGERSDQ